MLRRIAMAFGALFLTDPEPFSARSGGMPWGGGRVAVDFAGGPYRFAGLSRGQAEVVRERFGDLVGEGDDGGACAVEIGVVRAEETDFRRIELEGWSYSLDLAYTPTAVSVAGLRFLGRLEWTPHLAATLWTPLGGGADFQGVLDNFFRLVAAYALLEQGGALLHSAAVVDGGGAYLFFGPSGAGKSTLSRLGVAAGRQVLSDDLNALWGPGGRWVVEQVPFAGDLGRGATRGGPFPTRAALRLEKGRENGVRPASRAEAFASLLACSPYVNSDPHRSPRLEGNLHHFLERLPTGTLTFAKDSSFEELLQMIGRGL